MLHAFLRWVLWHQQEAKLYLSGFVLKQTGMPSTNKIHAFHINIHTCSGILCPKLLTFVRQIGVPEEKSHLCPSGFRFWFLCLCCSPDERLTSEVFLFSTSSKRLKCTFTLALPYVPGRNYNKRKQDLGQEHFPWGIRGHKNFDSEASFSLFPSIFNLTIVSRDWGKFWFFFKESCCPRPFHWHPPQMYKHPTQIFNLAQSPSQPDDDTTKYHKSLQQFFLSKVRKRNDKTLWNSPWTNVWVGDTLTRKWEWLQNTWPAGHPHLVPNLLLQTPGCLTWVSCGCQFDVSLSNRTQVQSHSDPITSNNFVNHQYFENS